MTVCLLLLFMTLSSKFSLIIMLLWGTKKLVGRRGHLGWAHAGGRHGTQNNPVMRTCRDLLCKFNAELREVFPRGSQVVTDDGDVLFNVKNDRGDVGALVTNMLHILPLHLKMETGQDKPLDPVLESSLTC